MALRFSLLQFFPPNSFPFHRSSNSNNISIMPCRTVSSLASSTTSRIFHSANYSSLLRCPNDATASLVWNSLCKLHRIDEKRHHWYPCLTPLPVFTFFFNPWSSRSFFDPYTMCRPIVFRASRYQFP